MKNQNEVLAELKKGNQVITKTSQEEMDIINLLVDAGYGNDVQKESVSKGVFTWAIRSIRQSVLDAVEEIKSNGVEVRSSESNSPFTGYFPNKSYYILESDSQKINKTFKFVENWLHTIPGKEKVKVLDIIPQI